MSAVVFDLDDTLVDEASAIRSAVLTWSRQMRITSADTVDRWLGASAFWYQRYLDGEVSYLEQGRARVRQYVDEPISEQSADDAFALYQDIYRQSWRLFDDAVPALVRARDAGLTVAILTNGDEFQQRLKMETLGLLGLVDQFHASSALGVSKPHPHAFGKVLDSLGRDPADVLMVGDHPVNDIAGGDAAGMQTILVDRQRAHGGGSSRVASLDEITFGVGS